MAFGTPSRQHSRLLSFPRARLHVCPEIPELVHERHLGTYGNATHDHHQGSHHSKSFRTHAKSQMSIFAEEVHNIIKSFMDWILTVISCSNVDHISSKGSPTSFRGRNLKISSEFKEIVALPGESCDV